MRSTERLSVSGLVFQTHRRRTRSYSPCQLCPLQLDDMYFNAKAAALFKEVVSRDVFTEEKLQGPGPWLCGSRCGEEAGPLRDSLAELKALARRISVPREIPVAGISGAALRRCPARPELPRTLSLYGSRQPLQDTPLSQARGSTEPSCSYFSPEPLG